MHDLGQYLPGRSALHNSDPRVKLSAVLALSVVLLRLELPGLLAAAALILGAALLAKISPVELVRSTRPVWPFFVILFLVYLFTTPGTPLQPCSNGLVKISHEGLYLGLSQLLRFLLLVLAASILAMTTSLPEITMALEYLVRPLRIIGISSHNVALMVSMALRFLPLLRQELEQVREAGAARGADFKYCRLTDKVRLLVYLATPLTLGIMRRCDELVEAMEARGYQPGPRTYLYELSWRSSDFYATGLVAAVILALWCLG